MDCTSNRVDCNVGLCGRFSVIFFRRERQFLRSKCMRLPQNAGDMANLTSEFKTLILCFGIFRHILVIQRAKRTVLTFFYYLTEPWWCNHMVKYFSAWPRPHAAVGEISVMRRNFQLIWIETFYWWNFGSWWRRLPMIVQVHNYPLSFSVTLF